MWSNLWLPIRQYAGLFRFFTFLQCGDLRERERLRRLYRRLSRRYALDPPRIDPLRAEFALKLQAVLIKAGFLRMFGLRLNSKEAAALSTYGSVGLAAKDLLDLGGYSGQEPGSLILSLHLLIDYAGIRNRLMLGRQSVTRILTIKGASRNTFPVIGRVVALWSGAERLVCRTYWSVDDRRLRTLRAAQRNSAHLDEWRAASKPIRTLVSGAQNGLLAVLAQEMFWCAVEELCEEQARAKMPASQFLRSLQILQRNLESATSNNMKKENAHDRQVA
jgi:hypothetical protein